jgi:hypothetical protein
VALYALMFFEAFYKVPLRALRWLGDTPVLLLLGSATVIGFIMAMASLRRSRRNAPTSRQGWAEHHSQQLQVSIQRCHVWYGFLIPFLLTSEWRVSVLNAVLFTALNLYRLPRLRRELALLSHATEPLP